MDKLLTMNVPEEKLEAIDIWWKEHGFANRTEFIKFCVASVMDAHTDDSFVLVKEQYFDWMLKNLKEKIASEIGKNIETDISKIRQEVFKMVFQSCLRKLIEEDAICA